MSNTETKTTETPTAWQIVYNALESEGSKVIFDSEKGLVEWCPNSSECNGTPAHQPDCWLGQAMRLIPTLDTLPPAAPIPPTPDSETALSAAREIAKTLYARNPNSSIRVNVWDIKSIIESHVVGPREDEERGLNLLRQLVSGKNSLRTLEVFPCNQAEHEDVDCKCFWEQCEAWAKDDAARNQSEKGK